MAPATCFASSNFTSPTRRYPFLVAGSSTRFVPTSITTAPALIMSPVTNSGFPIATIRMSARRVTALISRVREWHTVTVALPPGPSCSSRAAMGRPTMLERPTITACLPVVSIPLRTSSCCTPNGVAGRNPVGSPIDTLPTFSGWKPSTSLAGATRPSTFCESICLGSGSCTRMPWIFESALSRSTSASSSACVVSFGRRTVSWWSPASSQALPFMRT